MSAAADWLRRNRRALALAGGLVLAALCQAAPDPYDAPCRAVADALRALGATL